MRISLRKILVSLCILALLGYGSLVGAMWYKQREALFNFRRDGAPFETLNLPDTSVQWLQTGDGVKLESFYRPPRKGRPIVLFFHGKGTSLPNEASTLRTLAEQDFGFLGVSYRGAGNSTGVSTEPGLVMDAVTAYDWLRAKGYTEDEIMVLGLSLGTGVAVQLAAQRPVAALAIAAPYSSVVEVAAERYWYLPVRLLMLDQFLSEEFIKQVKAPLLVLHGVDDRTIPLRFGEKLFAAANEPKQFERIAGEGHPVIFKRESVLAYAAFFNRAFAKTQAAQ